MALSDLIFIWGLILLLYSSIMLFFNNLKKTGRINVKRFYFTFFVFLIAMFYKKLEEIDPEMEFINSIGTNTFGLSTSIWFGFTIFIIGYVSYILVISDKENFSLGWSKLGAEQEIIENMEVKIAEYEELEDKIRAQSLTLINIHDILDPKIIEIINDIEKLKIEFKKILDQYSEKQKLSYIEFKIVEIPEIRRFLKLEKKQYSELDYNIESNLPYSSQLENRFYVVLPYETILTDYKHKFLIVYYSNKELLNAEEFLIVTLLKQFENVVLLIDAYSSIEENS